MKAFTEQEEIAYSTFLYWRRRLEETVELVPVEVVAEDDDEWEPIEIETRSGLLARIPRDLDDEQLQRLVRVLASC